MIFVTSIDKIKEFQKAIAISGEFVLDIETTGLDPFSSTILLIQIKAGEEVFVLDARNLGVKYSRYFLELLSETGKVVIGHNLKFDLKFIQYFYGIYFRNNFDTMLAEVLINNGVGEKLYSIKDVIFKYCGVTIDKSERESFYNYDGEITQQQIIYAVEDVMYLEKVKEAQLVKLTEQKQLKVLDVEMAVIPVISAMEIHGIKLDREKWGRLQEQAVVKSKQLELEMFEEILNNLFSRQYKNLLEFATLVGVPVKTKKLTKELEELSVCPETREWAEKNVNLHSHQQMKKILNLIGIPVENTNEKTLNGFKENLIIGKILEYREMTKKITSFGENFTKKINPATGRLHSDFFQLGTASGRFSSHDPNLLGIPRDSEYRSSFIPEEDCVYVDIDFSQEELRLFGAITKEPKFINAYKNKIDLHKLTASIIFLKAIEDVLKEERQVAKGVNFATVYGTTEYGLAFNFGFTIEKAREVIKNFWKGYPTAKQFKDLFEKEILKRGYSVTPLGRKRFFERKTVFADSREAEKYFASVLRELGNHPYQGCGADIIKVCLTRIFFENPFGEDMKIILAVHDEILLEVKKERAEEVMEFVSKIMMEEEQKYLGEIPAEVEGKISNVWEH